MRRDGPRPARNVQVPSSATVAGELVNLAVHAVVGAGEDRLLLGVVRPELAHLGTAHRDLHPVHDERRAEPLVGVGARNPLGHLLAQVVKDLASVLHVPISGVSRAIVSSGCVVIRSSASGRSLLLPSTDTDH